MPPKGGQYDARLYAGAKTTVCVDVVSGRGITSLFSYFAIMYVRIHAAFNNYDCYFGSAASPYELTVCFVPWGCTEFNPK